MSARNSKTTKMRITQFNNKHLYEKNNHLWCRPCNFVVDSAKKSSIEQHLVTQTQFILQVLWIQIKRKNLKILIEIK